jgi:hypothetical protein
MSARFTSVTWLTFGSLLAWLSCFVSIYVLTALACARGWADLRFAGLGIVPATWALLLLVAAGCTGALATLALRRRRRAQGRDSNARFIDFLALSLGLFALFALLWMALPALAAHSCAGQPVLS